MFEEGTEDLRLSADLKIDSDSLDVEWVLHPQMFMKWAMKAAQAEKEVRYFKEALKIADALIDKEIRMSEGIKITDSFIKAEIERDNRHKTAVGDLNTALYNLDILTFAVQAMNHKKAALENEVKLWQGSYFAGPREERNLSKEVLTEEERRQKLEERIKEKYDEKVNQKIDEAVEKEKKKIEEKGKNQ